jgi:hypothetical protein
MFLKATRSRTSGSGGKEEKNRKEIEAWPPLFELRWQVRSFKQCIPLKERKKHRRKRAENYRFKRK